MRGTGIFFLITLIWNTGIIATTPFDGAHYLTDIIGGVVVMVASVFVIHRLEPYLETVFSRKLQTPQLTPQPQ
jgi:membrane-associated phospholipid phosphatase